MKKLVLAMMIVGCSTAAWAQSTCQTSSAGRTFKVTDINSAFATQAVVSQCAANPRTINSECTANVVCASGYEPQSTCQTMSAGKTFSASGQGQALVRQDAVAQCQSDSRTINSECTMNVVCANAYEPESTCQTKSAGQVFNSTGLGEALVRQNVIAQCQSNPRTVNSECVSSVLCANANARPATCQTTSANKLFRATGVSGEIAKQTAVAQCQGDSRTINSECTMNVVCDDGLGAIGICQTASGGGIFRSETLPLPFARQSAVAQCKDNPRTVNSQCEQSVVCQQIATLPPVVPPVPKPPKNNEKKNPPASCYVRPLQKWVAGREFYDMMSERARYTNRCVVAKFDTRKNSGRIFRADGTRYAKDRDGLSDSEILQVLSAGNLYGCETIICEDIRW